MYKHRSSRVACLMSCVCAPPSSRAAHHHASTPTQWASRRLGPRGKYYPLAQFLRSEAIASISARCPREGGNSADHCTSSSARALTCDATMRPCDMNMRTRVGRSHSRPGASHAFPIRGDAIPTWEMRSPSGESVQMPPSISRVSSHAHDVAGLGAAAIDRPSSRLLPCSFPCQRRVDISTLLPFATDVHRVGEGAHPAKWHWPSMPHAGHPREPLVPVAHAVAARVAAGVATCTLPRDTACRCGACRCGGDAVGASGGAAQGRAGREGRAESAGRWPSNEPPPMSASAPQALSSIPTRAVMLAERETPLEPSPRHSMSEST